MSLNKEVVIIDSRLKNLTNSLTMWSEGVCSIRLVDIDEIFWFENKNQLQEFLNVQARERFYSIELRRGYFDYVNEDGEMVRYNIFKLKQGKIDEFNTVFL